MIAVFKTTVNNHKDSNKLIEALKKEFPESEINFDLEDCDNILRIESHSVDVKTVINVMADYKYKAVLMEKTNINVRI